MGGAERCACRSRLVRCGGLGARRGGGGGGSGQSYWSYQGALQTTVHQSLAWASWPFWRPEPGCKFRCPTVVLVTVAVTSPVCLVASPAACRPQGGGGVFGALASPGRPRSRLLLKEIPVFPPFFLSLLSSFFSRGPKKVCIRKISLKFAVSLVNFIFWPEEHFPDVGGLQLVGRLMWVGGVGGGRGVTHSRDTA